MAHREDCGPLRREETGRQHVKRSTLDGLRNTCYSDSMRIKDLTPAQRKSLAKAAGTSEGSIRQMQTRRRPSSRMAIRLELAGRKLGLDLRREQMAAGCDSCEFARKCRKSGL